MNLYTYLGLIAVVSYIIGSIPFGFIIGKIVGKKDIRKEGSGGTGMTNVLRTTGKIPAVLTLMLDAAKGIVAILVAGMIINQISKVTSEFQLTIMFLAGFLAVVGHCYPVWLKFKGGKGFGTAAGVVGFIYWPSLVIGFVVWLVVVLTTKYISAGTIITCILTPIITYIVKSEVPLLAIYMAIMAVFIIIMHRKNIKRLFSGTENRPTSSYHKKKR